MLKPANAAKKGRGYVRALPARALIANTHRTIDMKIIPLAAAVKNIGSGSNGRAWAAIKNGQAVAVRYMGDWPEPSLPAWVHAMRANGLPRTEYELEHKSGQAIAELKKVAVDAGHHAQGPRGGNIKPTDIIRQAMRIVSEAERDAFQQWREKCRAELAEVGTVQGGWCDIAGFTPWSHPA